MLKSRLVSVVLLLTISIATLTGCLLEEKVLSMVLRGKACFEYEWYREDASFASDTVVDVAQRLDEILEENGFWREKINKAFLVSTEYKVTDVDLEHHDWVISGELRIAREDTVDGPATLLTYSSQSVHDAYLVWTPAALNADGVDLLNRAFEDYLAGADPVLRFTVVNSDVVPAPSAADPLLMDWKVCVNMQVVYGLELAVPAGPWW